VKRKNKFEAAVKRMVRNMLLKILWLEEVEAIFIKRVRIHSEGAKLDIRCQRASNSHGDDNVQKLDWHFKNMWYLFWAKNRIDHFFLDIDITQGVVDVTWHDWGIVYGPDDHDFRAWSAVLRPPREFVFEAYIYDEPHLWFPTVCENATTMASIIEKLDAKGDEWLLKAEWLKVRLDPIAAKKRGMRGRPYR
jgi:hypothetical protein